MTTRSYLGSLEIWFRLVFVRPQRQECAPTIAPALLVNETLNSARLDPVSFHQLDYLGTVRHIRRKVADQLTPVARLNSIPVCGQSDPLVSKPAIRADFLAPLLPLGEPRFQRPLHSLAAVNTCRFRFQEVKKSHPATLQGKSVLMIAVLVLAIGAFSIYALVGDSE